MDDACLQVAEADGVVTVTLDRAAKLNALTPAMLAALGELALRLDARNDVRCVILTGASERAFCVGADITAWADLAPLDMWRQWVRRGHRVFDLWARLRPPVIAALNGHALGGGLELAAVADIRIADQRATFGLPEASIATCPGWSGTQRLAGLIGASRVKYLALTGSRIDAATALAQGLVHEVVPAGAALPRARELALRIARLAPVSLQLTKQLIDAANGDGAAVALEAMAGAVAAATRDAAEGVASFREKRPAHYLGE